MNRYIISNSDAVKDVMNVYAFFTICGYKDEEINMDIVPLFETMEGLANAEHVMNELYQHPVYKNTLKKRKPADHYAWVLRWYERRRLFKG